MSRALQLAERGLFTTDPNPRVGCVIVKESQIVGEGWHQRAGEAHAEVNALKNAGFKAKDADCYVTLEPCSHFGRTSPCADTLINAGLKRVFIAMMDPNPRVAGAGIAKLEAAGIEVIVGILGSQAEQLNLGFCQRMRIGRPYVRSKMAMSVDGRTAMASGESKWITGTAARQDVQKLRARSSAILTGIGTVLADDPALTVRPEGWYPQQTIRQPLRVVVDSQLRTPADAKIFADNAKVLIASSIPAKTILQAEVCNLPSDNNRVDLTALMTELAKREINEVMVEAGSLLNGALLAAGLIDELVIYMAPKIMGNDANGLFHLPDFTTMAQNIGLQISDIRAVGHDWRITALPQYNKDN
ncbi:MAG: diaminohydroxyphosphoribosylaminopyrimidine deaminase [Methylophagaceae bacterium]|jgi:diaminohydroxyphosphoribosylaminopyrimidine deaminase/5-amino-6-(5-phosphoribosylamino)uracil reductase